MDLETRVEVLEKNFAALLNVMKNNKFYTDADIAGVQHSSSEADENIRADIDFIAMETGVDL